MMQALLKTVAIAAVVVAPITAQAGGLAPVIEETPPVVIADTPTGSPSSGAGLIVPLLLLGLVGLAATGGTSGSSSDGGAKGLITGQ